MHRFSHLSYFTGVRNGRQRSPNIAVEVEILKILPKNTNKLVSTYVHICYSIQLCSLIFRKKFCCKKRSFSQQFQSTFKRIVLLLLQKKEKFIANVVSI